MVQKAILWQRVLVAMYVNHYPVPPFLTLWTLANQAPLSMGILSTRILEWGAIPFSRGIFLTQGSSLGLLHCRQTLYHLSRQGSMPAAE